MVKYTQILRDKNKFWDKSWHKLVSWSGKTIAQDWTEEMTHGSLKPTCADVRAGHVQM